MIGGLASRLCWVAVVLFSASFLCGALLDPDLWWHITAGKWILNHGTIPRVDHWTMFAHGSEWRAYSWPYEIVFALIDSAFGIPGLVTAQLLLAVTVAATVFYCFGRMASSWFFGSAFALLACAACYDNFTLRPQCMVWAVFCMVVYQSWKIPSSPSPLREQVKISALMCLWANTHISSFLGMIAIFSQLAGSTDRRTLTVTLLFAFCGTLLTPYVGGEWVTFMSKTSHPFSFNVIAEFQPANLREYSTGLLLILLLLYGVFSFQSEATTEVRFRVMALFVFVLGGLTVVKFIPFAAIYAGAILSQDWRRFAARRGQLADCLVRGEQTWNAGMFSGVALVSALLISGNIYRLYQHPIDYGLLPVAAVDFIAERNLPHPVLNDFGHGGYLIYRFSNPAGEPLHRVAIDGRTNLIPPEIWSMNMSCLRGSHDWRRFFEKVQPQTVLWWTDSPLTTILLQRAEWCRVFRSHRSEFGHSVFVKREVFEARRSELSSDNCN